MKKAYCIIALLVMILSLVSCSSETTYTESEYEEKLQEYALGYVIGNYSLGDFFAEYENQKPSFYDEFSDYLAGYDDYPSMKGVLDELGGRVDLIEELCIIADQLGYCPSGILGTYFYDSNENYLHYTNSDCLNTIPKQNISFPCFVSREDMLLEISDQDGWFDNAKLCPMCLGNQ